MSLLSRYLLGRLMRGYGIMLVSVGALVWLISLLDVLGDAGSDRSLWLSLVSSVAGVPIGLIDLLPVVIILATASVLSGLQAQHELTVMRASGVSVVRIARLAMLPAVIVAVLALGALQFMTPVLFQPQEQTVGGEPGETSLWHPWHGLWVRSDRDFMNVGRFEPGELPGEIAIYEFADDGRLERQIRAEQAVANPEAWTLENVTIKSVTRDGPDRIRTMREFRWTSFLTARQLELFRQPPASLPLTDLWTYVESLKTRGQDASEFELVLWRRVSLPLAALGMVLIAAALSASPGKSRAFSLKLVAAVGIGLGYHLLAGMAGFFALVANIPPAPVVLIPPVLLVLLALMVLFRSR